MFWILIAGNLGNTTTNCSQGIQIEYIALFLSVIFPGALVAFNYNLLQALPSLSALRIYCAGIWHNFVVSFLEYWFWSLSNHLMDICFPR